jgi:argonaute-like protein implicated in RNA metabolism and viral defense
VPETSYVLVSTDPSVTEYQLSKNPDIQKQFNGYVRNVALTKVMLTNEKWPFVLHTPLHADLNIGIDVTNFTAGFTIIGKSGGDIRTHCETSNQKEKLSRNKVKTILASVLRTEKALGRKDITTIVIHRDGRLFPEEIKGVEQAIQELKNDGLFTEDTSVNFLEIPKTSPAPLRLFDIIRRPGNIDFIENPQIGSYHIVSNQEAYLCSTGKAFPRQGTTNPLHVSYKKGAIPFEHLLEDLYSLTCLPFTRPEDCTRYPLTVKLTDIRLREHARDYDEDTLKYGDESEKGGEDE